MGKAAKSSSLEEIRAILQRLNRSKEVAIHHPPNQAQTLMGRRLGVCFLTHLDEDIGHEIIQVLNSPTTNDSVQQAFFQTLQSPSHSIPVSWISAWIQLAQEAERANTLYAVISFYAWHCRDAALHHRLDADRIANTFIQLQPVARPHFATMMTQVAGSDLIRPLLSPIMATAVLTLSNPTMERIMILDIILRSCWSSDLTPDIISWHIESLTMFIGYTDESITIYWLTQVMDMMAALDASAVSNLLTQVICDVLPHLFESSPSSLQAILASALQISQHCPPLDDKTIFQLATMILSTTVFDDRRAFLQMLEPLSRSQSTWSANTRTVLASIFAQDEFLTGIVAELRSNCPEPVVDRASIFQIIEVHPTDFEPFLDLACNSLKRMDASKVPVLTQNAFLLLACGLLLEHESDDSVDGFVKVLLQKFPHLGIPMAPVLLDSMRQCALDGRLFLRRLRFLCESLVSDPHCAQDVWNLVGLTLAQKDQPLSVRIAAIRMYSTLCASNRRLYRRVVDSLGTFVEERQAEIRLAVGTVVCEMAEQDLIRDVADVIGWLQTYLQDEHPSIVHVAIQSLHYLILNGELDFDLVIKVLGKRLCAVGDLREVVRLDPVVLEALVVLLGDGEIIDEDADNRDGGLSPQVLGAVQTLVELAESNAVIDERIRFMIFQSLANYSVSTLGVDEEAIKAVTVNKAEGDEVGIPEVSHRYVSLCKLVKDTFNSPPSTGTDAESPVDKLARKLIQYEEEVLGASIWQKGHKNLSDSKKMKKTRQVSKAAIAALPKPDEVFEVYHSDPSASTAIAALLCFDGKNLERLADVAGDLSNETLSPMLKILNIQAWLQGMSRLWAELSATSSGSLLQDLGKAILEIQGWSDISGDIDYSQLALVSLSLYIPDSMRVSDGPSESDLNLAPIVGSITAEAEKAFSEHQFVDLDIGHLCLALAGVRSLHAGSNDVFAQGLRTLTTACSEGMGSIGLFFGLSLMAQSIPTGTANPMSRISADRSQRHSWIGQLVGCLINELQLCFVEGAPAILTLVASITSASPSPGMLKQVKQLGDVCIQNASSTKAKSLFMSLSACIHTLLGIHRDLLHALFHLLLKLPFGSGVEYVFASICSIDTTANIFTSNDLELLKRKLSETSDPLAGLYLSASLTTETNCKSWVENNTECFKSLDQMLALAPVVGSLPILGIGEVSSLASAKVYPRASANLISVVLAALTTSDSEGSIVLRGLLSSMSLHEVMHSDAVVLAVPSKITTKAMDLSLDASKLPTPNNGTLLFHLISFIRLELALLREGDKPDISLFCRQINLLSPLSLPGQFATDLLGPLMTAETYSSDLSIALLRLLLSQYTGRRRAAMDGRDFVSLAVHVISIKETTLFDNGGEVFFDGMSDLIRKSSSDLADSIVSQSWELCLFKLTEHGDTVFACKWLEAMAGILIDIKTKSSLSLSPRTSSMMRLFVVQDIFQSLTKVSSTDKVNIVVDQLIRCLSEISFDFLDELSFFSLDGKRDTLELLWKTRCIAALVGCGCVEDTERVARITTSLFAWFSRQSLIGCAQEAMRNVGLLVASSIGAFNNTTKNQVALLLLEAMLVHGHDVVALELLALVLNNGGSPRVSIAVLCVRDIHSLPALSGLTIEHLWASVLQELPRNLGTFARRTKTERMFSNRIVQVLKSWEDKGAPEEKLSLLQSLLYSCKSNDSSEKDTIAIMASRLSATY